MLLFVVIVYTVDEMHCSKKQWLYTYFHKVGKIEKTVPFPHSWKWIKSYPYTQEETMQTELTLQEKLKDLRMERKLTLEQLAEQT